MNRLVRTISDLSIKWPFNYLNYLLEKPPGMRHETYRKTVLKLQMLENMRYTTIAYGCRYSATDIRRYTSEKFIDLFEIWQPAYFQIFGMGIPPEYFSILLSEDMLDKRRPHHIGPTRLIIKDPNLVKELIPSSILNL